MLSTWAWPLLVLAAQASAHAQSAAPVPETSGSAAARWFQRSDRVKAGQPHWVTPLATTTPRLEQEFRSDVVWQQPQSQGAHAENIGNGKGLELIPFDKVEVILAVPPYLVHHSATIPDGFGDWRFLLKYRLLSANEETGNYLVTAFLDVSLPTASEATGQPNAIVTATLGYGKGFGHFDIQGTFGVALPAGNEPLIGRTYTCAGVQIAVSAFHTSTHNVIVTARLPF